MKRIISILLAAAMLLVLPGFAPERQELQVQDGVTASYTSKTEKNSDKAAQYIGVWYGLLDTILEVNANGTAFYQEPLNSDNKNVYEGVECMWKIKNNRIYFYDVNGYTLYAKSTENDYMTLRSTDPTWNTEAFKRLPDVDRAEDVRPLMALADEFNVDDIKVKDLEKRLYEAVAEYMDDVITVNHKSDVATHINPAHVTSYETTLMNEGFLTTSYEDETQCLAVACKVDMNVSGQGHQSTYILAVFENLERSRRGALLYDIVGTTDMYDNYNECVQNEMFSFLEEGDLQKVALPFGFDFYNEIIVVPTTVKTADSPYILPQSATQLLTNADVAGLSADMCRLARNEIFARHGRMFKDAYLQNYFNAQSWYHGTIPADSFNNNLLSQIEMKNAVFLENYEKALRGGK